MVAARIIPCLDIDKGRVVKGVRFQDLRDSGDPVVLAASYEAQGADEIVFLDVSATPEGRKSALGTVRRVREVLSIPLTVGGGVRSTLDAGNLLEAGADKVAVNTAAVERPPLIEEISAHFGAQCTVLAVDAALVDTTWELMTHSGTKRTGIDSIDWCHRAEEHGAGEILLTSWDRDGTGAGYDTRLIRSISSRVRVPVVASGGAGSVHDLAGAIRAGASAALLATMLHDRLTTVGRIKETLTDAGIQVRP